MPRLTLTFDNGPTPGITETVLDALDAYNVKSTFFLVGKQLENPAGRALAHRAKDAGHWIGNHSYSHGQPLGSEFAPGRAKREIDMTASLLGDLAGNRPLFRPNGSGKIGHHLLNQEAVDVLSNIRATIVLWTSVPKDKKTVVPSAHSWLNDAKSAVFSCDWSLMVLHDRPSGHDISPMTFLPEFLSWANAEHVEIVQDFPKSCLPMIDGAAQDNLTEFVCNVV